MCLIELAVLSRLSEFEEFLCSYYSSNIFKNVNSDHKYIIQCIRPGVLNMTKNKFNLMNQFVIDKHQVNIS